MVCEEGRVKQLLRGNKPLLAKYEQALLGGCCCWQGIGGTGMADGWDGRQPGKGLLSNGKVPIEVVPYLPLACLACLRTCSLPWLPAPHDPDSLRACLPDCVQRAMWTTTSEPSGAPLCPTAAMPFAARIQTARWVL